MPKTNTIVLSHCKELDTGRNFCKVCLEDHPEINDYGYTVPEALGNLIRNNPDQFGIRIRSL